MERGLFALERDAWSAPFFDAAARGQLLILHCDDCQNWSSPLARRCTFCSSERVTWAESDGRGEVVTWVVPHVRGGAGTEPAYVVAIVELPEGPWIYAHGPADLELHIGQQVAIGFMPVAGGEPLPYLSSARS
ncbi:Zn-ribbon domain-containing OB-fold protein (plasmid) [Nocardioides sp. R1-1]|uniref:Zn-ribbon domain-containing OB-fold protein n=1 Tax=Nocardioides sp. R1-1 TaxID=3383502 RepID=UPI0038CFCF99